ncbi:glycosyltransferase [Arthrobacter bambusae]|uniref:glycosyltransferase n=1 Tax=Arthrobacter bambusae TaxID=1338426 RepID=UPI0027852544|nr:glycosyltransferase [Arthrobacter bambusae]MDQ0212053.1 glycosyltransferase involved in cell wall biosynthesis [Arthrobacter bambusae]MDQ0236718.1 glycosyltransferase involved in cell wall biosynthesis [Arthrobacter bambusae]
MTGVSIGMPYTDQVDQLKLAINSVIGQSHQDWELILVGDGPSRLSVEMAHSFDDPRIRHFENPTRLGLASTLNRIASLAQYSLLARMDSDDLMHPERIAKQQIEFERYPTLDVVGSNAYLIDGDSNVVGAFREPTLPTGGAGFLRSNAFSHPTVMARTNWFRMNPYNEALLRGQDKELWLRTWETSHFSKLSDRLMYYRVPRQLSAQRLVRNEIYNRRIIRMYLELEPSKLARSRHIISSFGKQILFFAAEFDLVSRYLYHRRWTTLTQSEQFQAELEVRKIMER